MDEAKPWQVELCVSVQGSNADEARDLAGHIERSVRLIGGSRVRIFSDQDGPQDGGDDAA